MSFRTSEKQSLIVLTEVINIRNTQRLSFRIEGEMISDHFDRNEKSYNLTAPCYFPRRAGTDLSGEKSLTI